MQHRPAWAPNDIDIERPAVARTYGYLLGGSHNFASDRELAEQTLQVFPDASCVVRANRSFPTYTVPAPCALGVDKFLDLLPGIPTAGNVHEIVARERPGAVTMYVDSDPVAVAFASAPLAGTPRVSVLHTDLRDRKTVLAHAADVGGLDFSRPVDVLMLSVPPLVPQQHDLAALVAAYRDATVPGSYLAISHGTNDHRPKATGDVETVYGRTSQPGVLRSTAEVQRFFDGYDLLEPGLVDVIRWRRTRLSWAPISSAAMRPATALARTDSSPKRSMIRHGAIAFGVDRALAFGSWSVP